MKKIFTALLMGMLLLESVSAMAQSLSTKQSNFAQSAFTFNAPTPLIKMQQANGVTFASITFEGAAPSTRLGQPDLPVITEMIEIPLCSNVKVTIANVKTEGLEPLKYPIMPLQPAPCKSDRSPKPFVFDSVFYATNAFTDHPAAWVEVLGVARDRNIALLRVSPVSYNPVTGEVRLITSMDITLTYENPDVAATRQMRSRYYSPDFSLGHRLLATLPAGKEIRNAAPLHYLIVAHSSFRGQLDEFVSWKKRQGIKVTVGYTDDPAVGATNTSIAAYTKSFYDQATDTLPAPTFLLIVGDHEQIPAFNSRVTSPASDHITDLYFATWTANDNIPDCYMGRFSARTVAELIPQIEKTLLYERYDFTDDSYLAKGILIAGEDGGYPNDNAYHYADPAMDYVAKYYVNAANGFTDVKYYKNNTSFAPAGVTVTGSCQTTASATTLRSLYNAGYGWINYSAHGNDDCWGTPGFNTNQVAQMTNNGKPSIMIGNCCLSGRFNTNLDACFGESLLRKSDNAGAVAYFGCTNSSYWPHDFCWEVGYRNSMSNTMDATYDANNLGMYDRLFHTHNEPFSAWHTTAGSINVAGNTAVETYGSYTHYYWEIYELFGDPSLMPWLGKARVMPVDAPSAIRIGEINYSVQAVPYAYVAITSGEEHNFIAAAYADATGLAEITLPASLAPGEYELSIWAQNYQPSFQTVYVLSPDGPYVTVTNIVPSQGQLHPGKTATFDITLTNIGNASPYERLLVLSSSDPRVTVIQPETHYPACAPGDTITLTGVNAVYLSQELSDGDRINLNANVHFGSTPSAKSKVLQVSSSLLHASDATTLPSLTANTASTITCTVTNSGSDTSSALLFDLQCPFGLLSTEAAQQPSTPLAPGESVNLTFNITMGNNLPNANIPFYLYVTTDNGTRLLKEYGMRCGINTTEDFESGNFLQYNWTQNSNPWEVTSSQSTSGQFSARSKVGLGNRSESKLSIEWTSVVDDSISFSYKVSSEENWDKFSFSIDGGSMMEASGETDWVRVAFPVTAGNHTFAFSYTKDRSASNGYDCAWIDDVSLPFAGDQCAFTLDTVCQGADYTFHGRTVNTSTTGVFSYVDTSSVVSQYLSLTVMPEPEVEIAVTNIDGCMLLQASGASTYEWSTGETGSAIAICPTEPINISVTGYRGGCSSTASVELLSIQNNDQQTPVQLYPNPAHNSVTVAADGIRNIELINLVGQTIKRSQVSGDRATLSLQGLSNGVYFVKVETNQAVVIKKLVRQ